MLGCWWEGREREHRKKGQGVGAEPGVPQENGEQTLALVEEVKARLRDSSNLPGSGGLGCEGHTWAQVLCALA